MKEAVPTPEEPAQPRQPGSPGRSSTRRRGSRAGRLAAATVVVAGILAWGTAAPASAFPDGTGEAAGTARGERAAERAERRSRRRAERLADVRVEALRDLDVQADRHAADKAELMARLASYGYVGEPGELDYILPLAGYRLTGAYGQTGPMWATYHTGTDFAAPTGSPLLAIGGGVVTSVGDAGAYGLRTILTLDDGTELWYCHQSASTVDVGERVEPADLVGEVGSTGNTTGPHLHLEVRPSGGGPVDPLAWLEARGLPIRSSQSVP